MTSARPIISRCRKFLVRRLTGWRREGRRQKLLVDISVLSRRDAGTGIQRVVRALSAQLLKADLLDCDIRFVAATRRRKYRYIHWDTDGRRGFLKSGRIRVRAGDVFLGLDLSSRILPQHGQQISAWREKGVRIAIVVYDLLPVQIPQWFSEGQGKIFLRWLHFLEDHADQALCISRAVATDLAAWLRTSHAARADALTISIFPLGGDMDQSCPSRGITAPELRSLHKLDGKQMILIVGTIEPRKGHLVAIEAFDFLLKNHPDLATVLVIVGRPGWKTEELQDRMRNHPYEGDRFFWFEDASDELLDRLYRQCAGVLFPTFAEGFGLPVVEALSYHRPILVRDLPVFRELLSPLIRYFHDDAPALLAEIMVDWLADIAKEQPQCQHGTSTWQGSCELLLARLAISRHIKH